MGSDGECRCAALYRIFHIRFLLGDLLGGHVAVCSDVPSCLHLCSACGRIEAASQALGIVSNKRHTPDAAITTASMRVDYTAKLECPCMMHVRLAGAMPVRNVS